MALNRQILQRLFKMGRERIVHQFYNNKRHIMNFYQYSNVIVNINFVDELVKGFVGIMSTPAFVMSADVIPYVATRGHSALVYRISHLLIRASSHTLHDLTADRHKRVERCLYTVVRENAHK